MQPIALANVDVGILFILAVSSLGVYGIVLAGWASNSKYPFLGAIRSTAQMISYELAMAYRFTVFLWRQHLVQIMVYHSLGWCNHSKTYG